METYDLISNLHLKSVISNIKSYEEDFNSKELFNSNENKQKMLEWAKKDLEQARYHINELIENINLYIEILGHLK